MNAPKVARSVGVHDGTFHADEVTACALLSLFNLIDEHLIVRTRNLEELARCEYVCDVGGIYDPGQKLFDHHQSEYDGPLSSAGMIWQYLHEQGFVSAHEYHHFNQALIKGVDDHDNGRMPTFEGLCTFSHVISNFVPLEHDAPQEVQKKAFLEAFHFVRSYLKRARQRYQHVMSCREKVRAAMAGEGRYMIFEEGLPWLECFFDLGGEEHPAQFLIMPSGDHWKLRGIPPSYEERMKVRVPLPEEWAGLLEKELKEVSGIPGAIFCHKGRFISVWETREDALKALDYVLSKEKV